MASYCAELAHITAARYFKVGVSDVELLSFGGVSHIGGEMVFDPAKEIYAAIVGPATNFLLFGLGTALRNNGLWCNDINAFFLQANLMVAAFNLLPALPLDGGRVYRACLAKRIGFKEATYQAAWWGQFWGVLIVLGGVVGLVAGMSGLDIVITGAFLLYAAINEKALASYHFIRHLAQKKLELATVGVLPGETLVYWILSAWGTFCVYSSPNASTWCCWLIRITGIAVWSAKPKCLMPC